MNPQSDPPPVHPIQPEQKQSYLKRIFSGRLNRKNYTVGTLLLFAAPIVCYIIFVVYLFTSPATQQLLMNNPYDVQHLPALQEDTVQNATNSITQAPITFALLAFMSVYAIGAMPFAFSLQIRRLHDLNMSGWWILLGFVPIISYFFPLYVALAGGTNGENKYGPKPQSRISVKEDIMQLG